MDRFIAGMYGHEALLSRNLKSNMDRFIVNQK